MTAPINFSYGIIGIRNGLDGMQKAAAKIASKETTQGEDPGELARMLVDLKTSEHQVSASAEVAKATDEMLGSLLDTKA